MDIYRFEELTAALQSAAPGETLQFNIKNDIFFTAAVLVSKSVTIHITNASGHETVVLRIADEGTFRHFTTGGASIENLTMSVGRGVVLQGAKTGGGIQFFGSACLLTLDGCTVLGCRSALNGGGILMQGNVSRSRLVMNDALIENCQAVAGGGVFGSACDIAMNDGRITQNRVQSTGGGITTVAGANRLGSTITMNGGRIDHNVSLGEGGGITAHDTIVTIDGGEISSNAADGNGGGIYSFNQSGIESQNALIIRNGTVRGNAIRNFGAGIRTQNKLSEFVIQNSVITENRAVSTAVGSNQGGGIYVADGTTLTISGSNVSRNEAGTSGGGIFVNLSTLIVRGGTVICENVAAITAGGIYGYQGVNITIEENARVMNNHALCRNDPQNASSGGGGIALLAFGFVSTLTVRGGAVVSGNTSVSYGGGIWTYPTFGPETIVNIQGAAVEANTANFGGGISMGAVPGYTPVLTIADAVVQDNTANTDGGGIIAMDSLVSVSGSRIINNAANTDGGGIFTNELVNVTVDAASTFSGNTAGRYAFWTLTSGGDSEIHATHIFTDRFSDFVPVQTPPPLVWAFTNEYNNYDINYVRQPVVTVTVQFGVESRSSLHVHTTTIDSFLGATVTIPPRASLTDEDGTVWFLQPPDQPAQTIRLTDPQAEYTVTFSFTESGSHVTVREFYVDTCGRQLLCSTCTLVEHGGNYSKAAPGIPGYVFVGYRIGNGPLLAGAAAIIGIRADTVVTFVYKKDCLCVCRR